ncbi:MAG: AmmeMemoRadiSam system protein A [Eubacteriales bacterium]|nr:AmmeMemoRadiSam system protein A [Eubacteriales bacterium]
MAITGAAMVPHPPLIVPAVGRGGEKQISKTSGAYARAAERVAAWAPETVVIVTPHSIMYHDYIHISPGKSAKGDFGRFGASGVGFRVEYDQELVAAVTDLADAAGFPAGTEGEREKALDHGFMVPLYFLKEALGGSFPCRFVRVGLSGLPFESHYRLGMLIREAAEKLDRRVCVIASGDLSHYGREDGPYGFRPEGPEYDAKLMDIMGRAAFDELLAMSPAFCEKAGECGQRSFLILAGALDGQKVEAEILSYEGVTGVGYGVGLFTPRGPDGARHFIGRAESKAAQNPYVRLAVESFTHYLKNGRMMPKPYGLPGELAKRRAGAFVTLRKGGALRGCIGTISPCQDTLAEEIIHNAVSAAFRDPRFEPVRAEELPHITCSVDVLDAPEPVQSMVDLDVKEYGVIVSSGSRRGLLLPNLEGIETVEEQVAIARQKAGIGPKEPIQLERFRVVRHE